MRRLSLIIGTLVLLTSMRMIFSSPHGKDFTMKCEDCHTTDGWDVNPDSVRFNHDTTAMPLKGQHKVTGCRSCHQSLVFSEAEAFCSSCHTDMHENTVGQDCGRCHTEDSWIVTNIIGLHRQTRFPLLGAHSMAECSDCHISASLLRFEPLGIECIDCHREDYLATDSPDHEAAGYSTNCTDCHFMNGFTFTGAGINHDFFPLKEGHNISDCFTCHTDGTFNAVPSSCISCHQPDYNSAVNPNHINLNFTTECNECHTLSPGWSPAKFNQHDGLFPIYSGEHNGEWEECGDCHKNSSNYGEFTCTDCHEHNQSDMNDEHDDVQGYEYNSLACFGCHPTGSGEGSFNHSTTSFPLTGAHTGAQCLDCHSDGYAGTSTNCSACHLPEFNQSTNPNHVENNIPNTCGDCHTTEPGWKPATFPIHDQVYALTGAHATISNDCASCHADNYANTPNTCAGCHLPDFNQSANPNHLQSNIPNTCEDCHTTQPDWQPATFPIHNEYYVLNGAHATIANDCASCHDGDYVSTPVTCSGCHTPDYNQTTNPPHASAQFPTDCLQCHTETAWTPSTFQHDAQYFPIYSGEHNGEWDQCSDCHTNSSNYAIFSCIDCHEHNQIDMNSQHSGIEGYEYSSTACLACHPDGSTNGAFNHDNTGFPLNGAHAGATCSECHTSGYTGTPTACSACHISDYNSTTNPSHVTEQFPTECLICHDENAWVPSTFNHQASAFPLTGAHTSANCSDCHQAGYSGTSSVCFDCHQTDFSQSVNPNHTALNIPNSCSDCHSTEPGWAPATFSIHNQYYALNGAHAAISGDCASCHNGNYNGTPNTCSGCHLPDYNATTNPSHVTEQFPLECLICHTETAWIPSVFDHQATSFPLTGAHVATVCSDCHQNGYTGTSTICYDCHETDFLQSVNPSHTALNLPHTCSDCHSTQPGWAPASFGIHNQYYALNGAHAAIAGDCASCHNGNYTNTPNTCDGCHMPDYNSTTNPPHASAQYPTDCLLCHTEVAWEPSTFDHDNQYFPIYSGQHQGEWNTCSDCHTNSSNYAQFTCLTCHEQGETDNDHEGVSGYVYNSNACYDCHPDGDSKKKIQMQRIKIN